LDNFCISQSASFLQIGSLFKSPVNWQIPKYFTYLQETKKEHVDFWESVPNNNKYSIKKKKKKKKERKNPQHSNSRPGLFFSTQICCIISSIQVFALACLKNTAVPSWFIFQLRSGQLVRPGD